MCEKYFTLSYFKVNQENERGFYYATNKDGDWEIEPIFVGVKVGEVSSLVVDSDLNVHVLYEIAPSIDLQSIYYASNLGGSWKSTLLDSIGSEPTLAIDKNGCLQGFYKSFHSLVHVTLPRDYGETD